MKRIIAIFTGLFLLAGCGTQPTERDAEKLLVYTSFYAMEDFAKAIGGEAVSVSSLVPAGTEAHDWEPGPRDLAALEEADVFIYNSDSMEHWVGELAKKPARSLEAADGLEEAGDDPHVWLDPEKALAQMEKICTLFCEADPNHAEDYQENLALCREKIETLAADYRAVISALPQKKLIVTHGAYGYLCRAYGLEQLAVEGIQGSGDPSPTQMAEMIEEVRTSGISCIYYEADGESKTADAIARECGIKTAPLSPFEGDAAGRDYFTVMLENLKELQEGLS